LRVIACADADGGGDWFVAGVLERVMERCGRSGVGDDGVDAGAPDRRCDRCRRPRDRCDTCHSIGQARGDPIAL